MTRYPTSNTRLTPVPLIFGALLLLLGAASTQAERYPKDAMLNGAPVDSEHISGFQGTDFVVGVPDSSTNDDFAVFGLSSEEQRDHPCYVTVRTENINDSSGKQDLKKELCSGKEKSREMVATFTDTGYGKRSFVIGVRVCMNGDNTRVKGIQIRGKTIEDDARLGELQRGWDDKKPGSLSRQYPAEPQDTRPNCNNNWKRWALCPRDNQIATAVMLHFEAGKEPRSLTGIGLQCRNVGGAYVLPENRTP